MEGVEALLAVGTTSRINTWTIDSNTKSHRESSNIMQDILFPAPRTCRFYQRSLDFSTAQWIHIDPVFSPVLKSQVIDFAHRASPAFIAPLTVTAGPPQHGRLFLKMTWATSGIPAKGYELTADEARRGLNAGNETAAFCRP